MRTVRVQCSAYIKGRRQCKFSAYGGLAAHVVRTWHRASMVGRSPDCGGGGDTSSPSSDWTEPLLDPKVALVGGSYLDLLRMARAGPRGRPGIWMSPVVLSTSCRGSETESETNSFVGRDTGTNDSPPCVWSDWFSPAHSPCLAQLSLRSPNTLPSSTEIDPIMHPAMVPKPLMHPPPHCGSPPPRGLPPIGAPASP